MEAVAQLRAAVLVLGRRMRHHASDDALSATELSVLGRLLRGGPLTPGTLARAEHVRPPSMTRIIERLQEHGYVRREPHPDDGRQQLIFVTDAGVELAEEVRRLRNHWLMAQLDLLTDSERDRIRAALPALQRLSEAQQPE
ncbi:MarR family transcriptional regulator [Nakamurella sp. DB0629]|uniref:MarR family transcriptional regulator n=2 Tax=Nakamurella aerolata TaxID=1656892 RepID=A0A849A978_9ACTN|nr:MarR family transcriptional regulator [Nakamurella aerolata]NNG36123.1 MarR family transcriptional regulator [Nakamurella aerolata]